jgi:hypothetical protein
MIRKKKQGVVHDDDDDDENEASSLADNNNYHSSYYRTLLMALVLEVPMFLMVVCGYLKNVTSMDEDEYLTYPTETLKEHYDGLSYVIEGYETFYILACVRIVLLSFVLWAGLHGRQLYAAVSEQALEEHRRPVVVVVSS